MGNEYASTAGMKLLYRDAGSEDAFVQMAGIKKFGELPSSDTDEFETTRVDQVLDGGAVDWYKQFGQGHIDPGMLDFTLGLKRESVAALYSFLQSRAVKGWKILFSNGDQLLFDGWIKKVKPEAPEKDEVVFSSTVRVTGNIQYIPND